MVTEEFTFPVITTANVVNLTLLPPLWRIASVNHAGDADSEQENGRKRKILASFSGEIDAQENDEKAEAEAQEKMDVLWEDFNEELRSAFGSSDSDFSEEAYRNHPNNFGGKFDILDDCGNVRELKLVPAKRKKIELVAKMMKKLFTLHNTKRVSHVQLQKPLKQYSQKKMLPAPMAELMTQVGSTAAGLMLTYAMFQNYFPYELRRPLRRYTQKFMNLFYPYVQVTFPEYHSNGFQRNLAYAAIERYLNANSTKDAKRLEAHVVRDSDAMVFTMANHEEVTDEFQGIKLWWASTETVPHGQTISFYPRSDEKKFFRLTFHRRHRDTVCNHYLKHVVDQGKAITLKERKRKLYTNNRGDSGGYRRSLWSNVILEHPATFDTLAMDPAAKQEIIADLLNFSNSKDYYTKVGKPWKRGYLLYGPPGTGKSTMIAAMANLLKYDVYDVELTAVRDNTELRKLMINTSSKSIVVIEDIDCSLELTGQRKDQKKKDDEEKDKDETEKMKKKAATTEENNKASEVTLSGLLNFIDGLWSACEGERIIVFTTNHVEKLDPALIRRGRMDKHIELSYCGFEAFKVLARNYLDIDRHDLFATVRGLLEETKMTPADVAENLMPKSGGDDEDAESRLMGLIAALEEAKRKAREEEEKVKAEKVAKEEEEKLKAAKEEKKKKEEERENGVEKETESGGEKDLANGVVEENGEATEAG